MASQLKVDTITGVTTAGSIAVTGEGNSTTTNLQQGLCKCWAKVNQDTPAYRGSFNTSSLVDSATGNYEVHMSSTFSSIDEYVVAISAQAEASNNDNTQYQSLDNSTTAMCHVFTYENGSNRDIRNSDVIIQGTLA